MCSYLELGVHPDSKLTSQTVDTVAQTFIKFFIFDLKTARKFLQLTKRVLTDGVSSGRTVTS